MPHIEEQLGLSLVAAWISWYLNHHGAGIGFFFAYLSLFSKGIGRDSQWYIRTDLIIIHRVQISSLHFWANLNFNLCLKLLFDLVHCELLMFNFQIIDLTAWIRTLLYTLITAVSSRLDRSLVRTFEIHLFLALLAPDFFKIHLLFAVHLFLYLQLSWLLARSVLHDVDVLIFVLGSGMFTVIFAAYLGIVAGWASIVVLRLLRAATRPG